MCSVRLTFHSHHTHNNTDRLFTHRVGLPPKLLKPVFFGGPSRELGFLYCPAASGSPNGNPTGSGTTTTNGHSSCSGSGSGGTKSPGGSPALGPLGGNGGMDKGGLLQLEVRYRGSCLSRAVSLPVVTSALHRVIRSWLDKKLQGRDFDAILQMVQKLLAVFRPSEEVRPCDCTLCVLACLAWPAPVAARLTAGRNPLPPFRHTRCGTPSSTRRARTARRS